VELTAFQSKVTLVSLTVVAGDAQPGCAGKVYAVRETLAEAATGLTSPKALAVRTSRVYEEPAVKPVNW